MKKIFYSITISLLTVLCLASCNPKQQQDKNDKNEIDTTAFIQRGDSIATAVQQVLLANVMHATKSGGTVYAVTFCNERAITLTDSLSQKYNCQIQRISNKYRNPANMPDTNDEDILLGLSTSNSGSLLVSENGNVVYYKSIRIAMPSCLNCHGIEGKDISTLTLDAIMQKYPNDLATGYKEGDFRGLWKITFPGE